jgi:hypothetical protein
MKKTVLCKAIASIVAISICLSGISAFGQKDSIASVQTNTLVSPFFVAIVIYVNNLTLNSGGRLSCEGETEVQYGYIAGITIELQQYNGQWNTIKTWNASDSTIVSLNNDWYVASGYQYRLKLTHTAMNSSRTVIESFTSYSRTVTYN